MKDDTNNINQGGSTSENEHEGGGPQLLEEEML